MNTFETELLNEKLPRAFHSPSDKAHPLLWVLENKSSIDDALAQHGAALLRGFNPLTLEGFQNFIETTYGGLLAYKNRSTPRTALAGRVYTSTEYPSDQTIPQHNENAYTHEWPSKLFFYCAIAAERGGQTPISDSRRVLERIPHEIVTRFEALGVMYLRTFTPGLGLTWQETFQMSDRIQLLKYCQKNGIVAEWLSGGRLRIRQVLEATKVHPTTAERVWFNQAHLFHVSALTEEIQREIKSSLPPDEYPRNAFYGNGDPIENEVLEIIRDAYNAEESVFDWEVGDILIVDNILAAHGRKPFEGKRSILVAMT